MHLALDLMWNSRYTLYFPFRGWRFDPDPLPPNDLASFLKLIIWKITHQPEMLWGEVLGLAVLVAALVIRLRRPKEIPEGVRPTTP
jgi:hypothetical protein